MLPGCRRALKTENRLITACQLNWLIESSGGPVSTSSSPLPLSPPFRSNNYCSTIVELSEPGMVNKRKYKNSIGKLSRYCIPLAVIMLQSTINLTESNTEQMSALHHQSDLTHESSSHQLGPLKDANADSSSMSRHHQVLKVSPTRIRLFNYRNSYSQFVSGSERLSRNPDKQSAKLVANQSSKQVLFNGLRQPPAYGLWPQELDPMNQVLINRGATIVPLEHEIKQADSILIRQGGQTNLSTRNNLPRPMRADFPSETVYKAVLVRSVGSGRNLSENWSTRHLTKRSRKRTKFKRDGSVQSEDDENSRETKDRPDVEGDIETSGADLIEADEKNERQDDDDEVTTKQAAPSINFETLDDTNVESKLIPTRSLSPVYPPGDLDLLYSDALLVYVKDFNQFIRQDDC